MKIRLRIGLVLVALGFTVLVPAVVGAQVVVRNPEAQAIPLQAGFAEVSGSSNAPTPFGPGELLRYKVKLGILSVGSGHMAVTAVDTLRGRRVYHAVMGIDGGIPLARVRDTFQTWMDVTDLSSVRFVQDQDEVGNQRHRYYEMHPDSGLWRNTLDDGTEPLASSQPLDDISFVYFVRSLDLKVGETYVIDRYFKNSGNPVTIHVARIDTVEVPAGTFETIVVEPTIKTKGLFGEGGEAEIHFTNDERRLLVYLRSKVPVMGSLTLHLAEINEGIPLNRGLQEPPAPIEQAQAPLPPGG